MGWGQGGVLGVEPHRGGGGRISQGEWAGLEVPLGGGVSWEGAGSCWALLSPVIERLPLGAPGLEQREGRGGQLLRAARTQASGLPSPAAPTTLLWRTQASSYLL